jgi:hypothetical protein
VERLSLQETQEFWFGDEKVIWAFIDPGFTEEMKSSGFGYMDLPDDSEDFSENIWALPKREAVRGLTYLRELQACKTYGDAINLFTRFEADPQKPKLIPRIRDPRDFNIEGDKLDLELPFNFIEAEEYRDDTDSLVCVRDANWWTDVWMPQEIADLIGSKDTGYGMDYVGGEYLYWEPKRFEIGWRLAGYKVEWNVSEFLELTRFEYTG